jgi:nucleotidyltransferase-like protein
MSPPNQDGFIRIVDALAPYLDQLVFVGAWCHRLLQFHPLAAALAFAPLMTEDADVATPEVLAARSQTIDAALKSGGFKTRLSGDGPSPPSRYYSEGDESGLYVEFMAPLRGSGRKRDGEPDDVLSIAGITAQKLRFVELLLFEPWQLNVSARVEEEVKRGRLINLANPASYLAQKVLTLKRRQNARKPPKDALYIHDTLTMFADSFPKLRELGARVVGQLHPNSRSEFHKLRMSLFDDKSLIARAADIAEATGRASPPSAQAIGATCRAGLNAIFGT